MTIAIATLLAELELFSTVVTEKITQTAISQCRKCQTRGANTFEKKKAKQIEPHAKK
jgi:hypothetical protein